MTSQGLPRQCRHLDCARRDDCGFSHVVPVICNGQNCGPTCRFAHPMARHCRNGTACSQRLTCQFVHTDTKCSPTICRHWMNGYCEQYAQGTCTFGHPAPRICPSLCTPGCVCEDTTSCFFAHPVLEWCRFGSACTNVLCTRAHGTQTLASVTAPVVKLPAVTPTLDPVTPVTAPVVKLPSTQKTYTEDDVRAIVRTALSFVRVSLV